MDYYTMVIWKHSASGECLVRITSSSLPASSRQHHPAYNYVCTLEGREVDCWSDHIEEQTISSTAAGIATGTLGVPVDARCNVSIIISCLHQLYNVGEYTPTNMKLNVIGIGCLEQLANLEGCFP